MKKKIEIENLKFVLRTLTIENSWSFVSTARGNALLDLLVVKVVCGHLPDKYSFSEPQIFLFELGGHSASYLTGVLRFFKLYLQAPIHLFSHGIFMFRLVKCFFLISSLLTNDFLSCNGS